MVCASQRDAPSSRHNGKASNLIIEDSQNKYALLNQKRTGADENGITLCHLRIPPHYGFRYFAKNANIASSPFLASSPFSPCPAPGNESSSASTAHDLSRATIHSACSW